MARAPSGVLAVCLLALSLGASARTGPTEQVLVSWTPGEPNGVSVTPGAGLISWWSPAPGAPEFNVALVNSSAKGTSFTQNPHTATVPPGPMGTLDQPKHLAFAPAYNVTPSGRLVYTLGMTSQTFLPVDTPYEVVCPDDDIRLGSCSMNLIDFQYSLLVADIYLTNNGVWAYYARLPFARTDTNVYASFTYIKKIKNRRISQVHDLQIKYDYARNTLEWWVDGVRGLRLNRLGFKPGKQDNMIEVLDLGGTEQLVTPASFSPGFGCFTLLDFADSNAPSGRRNQGLLNLNPNPPTFYARPLSFQVDTRTNASAINDAYWRLFGQGTSMTVSKFKVAYELTSAVSPPPPL